MANSDATIKITADASGVVKGVSVAQGALAGLKQEMTQVQAMSAKGLGMLGIASGAAAVGLAVAAATTYMVSAVKAAADYGDQLDNMRQRTGIAVEELAKLQYAAKLSDTSTEALGKGLKTLSGVMTSAAMGSAENAAIFEKYNISLRDTADGSVRPVIDVLGDLADVFSAMPDGAGKASLAAELFGKKMGTEMIPLLNQGKDGIKALGDEATRLGLVMGAGQAKAAADFNDSLDKMSALSQAAKVSLGAQLIPTLNDFLQKLIFAKENKLSIGQILFDVMPGKSGDWSAQIDEAQAKLDKLAAAKKTWTEAAGGLFANTTGVKSYDKEIAAQEKYIAYLKQQKAAETADDDAAANKRILMASQLAGKLAQLEKLRSIASGQASIDILKSDKDLNGARLKDAEALRDALRAAYQSTVTDAKTAADAATALFDKARAKRNSAQDKAMEAGMAGLSDEEKAAAYAANAQDLYDKGRYASAAAGAAKLDGRLEQMAAYQKQAEEYLTRAEAMAEKSGNGDLISGIGEAQARAIEAQAKAKQQEADDLKQKAADQMATLNAVEAKLKELTTAAANFEIKADITQLQADIANMKKEIEKGAVMPITTSGGGIAAGGGNMNPDSGASGSFEVGGFTGWLGRQTVAGVVHGMEYVTPAGVTLQPGVIPFLEQLRRHGNKVLPGYEKGGLVSSLPTLNVSQKAANSETMYGNFYLDGQSHRVQATRDVFDSLANQLQREAMKRGGRR